MELICGACHGRLLAELPGTTVACPHCGTHLQTPAIETTAPAEASILFDAGDGDPGAIPNPDTDTVRMDFWVPPIEKAPGVADVFGSDLTGAESPLPQNSGEEAAGGEISAAAAPVDPIPAVVLSEPGEPAEDDADNPHKTTVVGFVVDPGAQAEVAATAPAPDRDADGAFADAIGSIASLNGSEEANLEPANVLTDIAATSAPSRGGNSQTAIVLGICVTATSFFALLSYACAVTLGCLYLSYLLWTNPRPLDLPDLAPPVSKDKRKVTSLIYLPPNKMIPSGNVLRLRESRQFGSVMVTPMRVTRGPVEFVYDDPTGSESSEQRDSEGPVLKLHLRFENVSKDQEFVPLDRRLVYTKELDRKAYGIFKANNFVSKVEERVKPANHVLVFDQSPDSSWLMKDQNLDRELNPGGVLDTYIATTPEQIESLEGDLVWRVHFRKGYNPKSLRGVTTLIEVLFHSSDIVDDVPPASPVGEDTQPVEPDRQPADEKPGDEQPKPANGKSAVKDA